MKKKTNKRTYRQLEKLAKELCDKVDSLKNELDNAEFALGRHRKEIAEMLFGKEGYGLYGSEKRDWPEIKVKIKDIKQELITEGKMISAIEVQTKEENSKLWYLVRVAMNDPKLTEPIKFESMESRFDRPNFN